MAEPSVGNTLADFGLQWADEGGAGAIADEPVKGTIEDYGLRWADEPVKNKIEDYGLRWADERADTAEPIAATRPRKGEMTAFQALQQGAAQTQGLFGGAAEVVGEKFDIPGLMQWGGETRREYGEKAAAFGEPTELGDIDSPTALLQYMKEFVPRLVPAMAAPVAAGAAAGALGSVAGLGTVGTLLTTAAGTFAGGYPLGVGGVQSDIKRRGEDQSAPGWALVGGLGIAALDTIVPGRVMGSVVKKFGQEAAEKMATETWKRALAKNAGIEGITESFQEVVQETSAAFGTDTPVDPELGKRAFTAGVEGALAGGIVHGVGSGVGRLAQRKVEAAPGTPSEEPTIEEPPPTGVPILDDTVKEGEDTIKQILSVEPDIFAAEEPGAPLATVPTEPDIFATTEPSVAEPTLTEPTFEEPPPTETAVREPTLEEPLGTEPAVTEPLLSEPTITEEPVTTAPAPSIGEWHTLTETGGRVVAVRSLGPTQDGSMLQFEVPGKEGASIRNYTPDEVADMIGPAERSFASKSKANVWRDANGLKKTWETIQTPDNKWVVRPIGAVVAPEPTTTAVVEPVVEPPVEPTTLAPEPTTLAPEPPTIPDTATAEPTVSETPTEPVWRVLRDVNGESVAAREIGPTPDGTKVQFEVQSRAGPSVREYAPADAALLVKPAEIVFNAKSQANMWLDANGVKDSWAVTKIGDRQWVAKPLATAATAAPTPQTETVLTTEPPAPVTAVRARTTSGYRADVKTAAPPVPAVTPTQVPSPPKANEPKAGEPAEQRLEAPREDDELLPPDTRTTLADLNARLEKLGLAPHIRLRLMNVVPGAENATGAYLNRLIMVSRYSPDKPDTLNHEVIHALRDLGVVTDSEWRKMVKLATLDADLVDSVNERYPELNDERFAEEMAADLFMKYTNGTLKTDKTPLGLEVDRIMRKIQKFLSGIRDWLEAHGLDKPAKFADTFASHFRTAEDIMDMIESGAVGKRTPMKGLPPAPYKSARFQKILSDDPDAIPLKETIQAFHYYAFLPRAISTRSDEFAAFYTNVLERFGLYNRLVAQAGKTLTDHNKFKDNPESDKRINQVAEIGRLTGQDFLKNIPVKNTWGDTKLSKKGDVINLTEEEFKGYRSMREAFNEELDLTREARLAALDPSTIGQNPALLATKPAKDIAKELQAKLVKDFEDFKKTIHPLAEKVNQDARDKLAKYVDIMGLGATFDPTSAEGQRYADGLKKTVAEITGYDPFKTSEVAEAMIFGRQSLAELVPNDTARQALLDIIVKRNTEWLVAQPKPLTRDKFHLYARFGRSGYNDIIKLTQQIQATDVSILRNKLDTTTPEKIVDDMKSAIKDFKRSVGEKTGPYGEQMRKMTNLLNKMVTERKAYQEVIDTLNDIEQAKRSGYVPLSRWGNVVVSVRVPNDPDSMRDLQDAITALGNKDSKKLADKIVYNFTRKEGREPELIRKEFGTADTREIERLAKKVANKGYKTLYSAAAEVDPGMFSFFRARGGKDVKSFPEVQALMKDAREYGEPTVFQVPEMGGDNRMALNPEDIDTLAEIAKISPNDQDALKQALIDLNAQKGFRRHFIRSENTPGYSTDFRRATADYVIGASGFYAKQKHAKDIKDALEAIPKEDTWLRKYAEGFLVDIDNPRDEARWARQLGFLVMMAFSPASGAVNLSQLPLVAWPYLHDFATEKSGFMPLTAATGNATGLFQASVTDPLNPDKLADDPEFPKLKDDLKRAFDEGALVPLTTHEMSGAAQGKSAIGRQVGAKFDWFMERGAYFTAATEQVNRVATFLAAYRMAARDPEGVKARAEDLLADDALARRQLLRDFNPYNFAKWVVDSTQFIQGKMNRPVIARGPIGATVMQFKSFPMSMLAFEKRLLFNMTRAKDPATRRRAKVGAAIHLLGIVALSGLMGIPGSQDLTELYEYLYELINGFPTDVKTDLRRAIYETTGSPSIAEGAVAGAPRPLANIDLGRIGLGNVFPGTLNELGGVPLALIKKVAQAAENFAAGRPVQAIANLSPKALESLITAGVWATDGIRNERGKLVLPASDVTRMDAFQKALGFSSGHVANVREAIRAEKLEEQALSGRFSEWRDDIKRDMITIYTKTAPQSAKDAARENIKAIRQEATTFVRSLPKDQLRKFNLNVTAKQFLAEINGPFGDPRKIYNPVFNLGEKQR